MSEGPYTPAWVPTLLDLPELLVALDIVPGEPVTSVRSGHGGVLGAQLLGQQVRLAERLVPGKRVQSLQTLFVGAGGRGANEGRRRAAAGRALVPLAHAQVPAARCS